MHLANIVESTLTSKTAWETDTDGVASAPDCGDRTPARVHWKSDFVGDPGRNRRPGGENRGAVRWDEVGQAARSGSIRREKGGSRPISRVLSWTTIHLGRTSPCASSDLPGSPCEPQERARRPACFPIWSCSRWGLPCRRMLPPARCALTAPFHPCRHCIAAMLGRFAFCCTFRGLAPPRRYLAPCPVEPGLSSTSLNAAVAWPTPARSIGD
jgi:hypothetical protein